MTTFLTGFNQSSVSISETLFKESNVKSIHIHMLTRNYIGQDQEPAYWSAEIKFQNGDVEGSKNFRVEGKNGMVGLVQQMEEFIKSL